MTIHAPGGGQLSAHLGYLFTHVPLEARPSLARAAGFDAIEHPAPFEIDATRLKALCDAEGLKISQISSGMGNAGEKGIAALPGREDEFGQSYAHALDYAEAVGAPYVAVMAGVPAPEDRGGRADGAYRKNLEAALRLCEGRKPQLLIEAISQISVPHYHMCTIDALLALAIAVPGLKILIDTYHAAATGVDPAAALTAAGTALGHVHIADYPGRHEPDTGTISFAKVITALAEIRYKGAIGFEYIPSRPDHLGWLRGFLDDPNLQRLRAYSNGVSL